MGCFFQNWRSISCSLRGSMLCMVLYLDCVSHQQLFEAVGARELSHHSHLRRRHRLLFGLWFRRVGHRCGGVRPQPELRGRWEGLRAWALACSWNQEVCHGAWGRAGRALAPAPTLAGQLARRAGQEPVQELAQSPLLVRGRRGSSRLLCLDRLFRRFPPSIYCPALARPARQPSRYMQKLMLVPRKFTTLPS